MGGLKKKCFPSWVYPGYQRFFSRAAGIFGAGRRPKPREKRAGHYKDLTETGNRARKVSGTQGIVGMDMFWKNVTFPVQLV